ncbi:MAG: hypothetical protein JSU74_06775 [Candidatus Zixiibacteriota bacterium]|nr:MAG: hypothetical protein JSU74_06775 [candidate division Zixibacteria bacterium]
MQNHTRTKASLIAYALAGLLLALIVAEVWLLVYWVPGSWQQRASLVLALIGIYGIAIGFFSKSEALADFRDSLENLTSPNIYEYLLGNFRFLTFVPLFPAVAFCKRWMPGSPMLLCRLGQLLGLFLTPIVFAYIIVHLLVVMPLTYLPTVLASALVSAVAYSGEDFEVASNGRRVSIRTIVRSNQLTAKAFLIGIPGIILSLIGVVSAVVVGG